MTEQEARRYGKYLLVVFAGAVSILFAACTDTSTAYDSWATGATSVVVGAETASRAPVVWQDA